MTTLTPPVVVSSAVRTIHRERARHGSAYRFTVRRTRGRQNGYRRSIRIARR